MLGLSYFRRKLFEFQAFHNQAHIVNFTGIIIYFCGTYYLYAGGLLGGLIYPDGAIFAPLGVFYMTKIGSKFHKMVQLAKLHWVRITDPIWDILDPFRGLQKAIFWANQALLGRK